MYCKICNSTMTQMSTILTLRTVNSRIELPIRSVPESALSLGLPTLSRSMLEMELCKFPLQLQAKQQMSSLKLEIGGHAHSTSGLKLSGNTGNC